MKIQYKRECENCKLTGDEFIITGSSSEDVKELMELHNKKVHEVRK